MISHVMLTYHSPVSIRQFYFTSKVEHWKSVEHAQERDASEPSAYSNQRWSENAECNGDEISSYLPSFYPQLTASASKYKIFHIA